MAKTKKRNRRHRRHKHRKEKHNTEPDEVRTCVSSEKLDRSCHKSPLHLVDIVTPILTPSPKFEEELLKLTEIHQSGGFRPRSKSTVPVIHSPLVDKVRCSIEKTPAISDHTNTPKSTSKLKQSDSYLEYKTPVKRIRSNSLIHSLTPIAQPTKKTKSSPHFHENKINVSFFNQALLHDHFSTPLAKISPIHNSTPKSKQQKDICIPKNNEINNGNKSKRNFINNSVSSLTSLKSLSPILKNIEDNMNNIQVIEEKNVQDISSVSSARKSYGKFKKRRWPMSLLHVFSWLQVAVKKGFAAFKRMIYGIQKEQSAMLEQSVKCSCKIKVNELKMKVNDLQEELIDCKNKLQCQEEKLSTLEDLKKEIKEMKDKMNIFKSDVCMPPPPPPPPLPPPPPPLLMMGPTPTSRPLKTIARKTDKQSNENSRPPITVDDILKVRLRKTTCSTPTMRKGPPLKPEDIFRQVKLRPPQRSQSPQILGTSPKSSLTRILKNVDTNVRSIRRLRKPQFMSFDDISRHPSFRIRPCGNDSAPVM